VKPANHCALLVVVPSPHSATYIERALTLHGITTRVRHRVAKVVEFGGQLGVAPSEVYVRAEDLARAIELLAGSRLVDESKEPGRWPAL
jgi:hypothetical protein